MAKQKDRVIIDTNLLISFLLSKNLSKLDSLLSKEKITLIFSKELLDEFVEVTQRPKFKKYFHFNDVEKLILHLRKFSELINVTTTVNECRDENDNFLLALSKDGNATHLISGDKDLLVLEKYKKTKIITISDYLKESSKH